jgi:hypothetical protein
VNSEQNKCSCFFCRLVSQTQFDCIENNSVGMSAAQEITSRNRFCVSEVDGNDAVFCRLAVLGFSFDEFWGSDTTFLEKRGVWKKTSSVYVMIQHGRRLGRPRTGKCPFGLPVTRLRFRVAISQVMHCLVCLATGAKSQVKRFLHKVRPGALPFKFQ